MDALRRMIIVLFGMMLSITISILVMINGWGLDPKSYWWIIGMGFLGQGSVQLIIRLAETKD